MTIGALRTMLLISGMRGNQCRETIASALSGVNDVCEVHVNLYRARAIVVHGPLCSPVDLIQAVVRAGYAAILHPLRPATPSESNDGRPPSTQEIADVSDTHPTDRT
jgi:hypothetical protein